MVSERVACEEYLTSLFQSYLKAQKESKKSNVTVTMMYLGQGLPGSTRDEMKVLQQICGGENICMFKGFVQPGGKAHHLLHCLRSYANIYVYIFVYNIYFKQI